MQSYLMPSGNLMVPKRAQKGSVLGDGMVEVPPDSPEGREWMDWYEQSDQEIPPAPSSVALAHDVSSEKRDGNGKWSKDGSETSVFPPESFKGEEGYWGEIAQVKVDGATIVYRATAKGDIELSSIRVPQSQRGQGVAKRAMQKFLAETDKRGLTVELIASPLDKKTNSTKLVNFYKKFGFKMVGNGNPAGDPKMVRTASPSAALAHDVSQEKRAGKGTPEGGQWTKGGGSGSSESTSKARLEKSNKVLRRYVKHLRLTDSEENNEVADWLESVGRKINRSGLGAVEDALGEERVGGSTEKVAYRGSRSFEGEGGHELDFIKGYLERNGIMLQVGGDPDPKLKTVASAPVPAADRSKYKPGDVIPSEGNVDTKLTEAKLLPGLESTEDIDKVVGSHVSQLTSEVVSKLDAKYGKDKWIIKTYGDEAYAGFGIFLPPYVAALKKSANFRVSNAQDVLEKSGYELAVSKKSQRIVGVLKDGKVCKFDTDEYESLPGDIREQASMASVAYKQVKGALLPTSAEEHLEQKYGYRLRRDSASNAVGVTSLRGVKYDFGTPLYEEKVASNEGAASAIDRANAPLGPRGDVKYMVGPAFESFGATAADQAMGYTWETGTEGRVHIRIVGGRARVVPFATLANRADSMPVVFRNKDIRAMEKVAQDTIDALPASERTTQVYAPDVMKTKDGWRVVELNSSTATGSSDWLEHNVIVMDAFASDVMDRDPMHVRFLRNLLRGRMKGTRLLVGGRSKKPTPTKDAAMAHDVSGEPRDKRGRWTKGGTATNRNAVLEQLDLSDPLETKVAADWLEDQGRSEEAEMMRKWPCYINAMGKVCDLEDMLYDKPRTNLDDANLRSADLDSVDLSKFSLRKANLHSANLNEAKLFNADLSDADLSRANLSGVDFTDANLEGADLHEADLRGASLIEANVIGANFQGANLQVANLDQVNFYKVNMDEADLSGAEMNATNLTEASLYRAKFSDAIMVDANLSGADLRGANLGGANLDGATFTGANLSRADLSGAILVNSSFTVANLRGADLRGANMQGAFMNGTDLYRANLSGADLRGATFNEANLHLADLRGAIMDENTLDGADITGAMFDPPADWAEPNA